MYTLCLLFPLLITTALRQCCPSYLSTTLCLRVPCCYSAPSALWQSHDLAQRFWACWKLCHALQVAHIHNYYRTSISGCTARIVRSASSYCNLDQFFLICWNSLYPVWLGRGGISSQYETLSKTYIQIYPSKWGQFINSVKVLKCSNKLHWQSSL